MTAEMWSAQLGRWTCADAAGLRIGQTGGPPSGSSNTPAPGVREARGRDGPRVVKALVEIRPLQESDVDTVVEFSLRAWEPVFPLVDQRPAGFVAIALNAFHERMGVVDMLAVDPRYQRRRIDQCALSMFAASGDS